MKRVLEILTGDLAGRSFAIDELPFTIGRRETCSIVLPRKFVSRLHAEIVERDGALVLVSLSRKNPVSVRGNKRSMHELSDRDEFEVGNVRFRFRERRKKPRAILLPKKEPTPPRGLESSADSTRRVSPAHLGDSVHTDEVDVKKIAAQAKDPFALDPAPRNKAPEVDTARERFLRGLVGVGALGIALALAIVACVSRPDPPAVFRVALSPPVAVGEVRHFEESWSENDPPAADLRARLDGEATDLVRALDEKVARVEWAVPQTRSVAHFLVHGIAPGQTTFEVRYRSGSKRVYSITVGGSSQHERARQAREEKLASLSGLELKALVARRLSQGEALESLSSETAPRHERYLRRVLHEYERAEEALERLKKIVSRSGELDPDLGQISAAVKEHADRAREACRKAREVEKMRYAYFVKRAQWDDAGKELALLLSLVGDRCDGDFQRYQLLLERWFQPSGHYGGRFEDPGCIESEGPEQGEAATAAR